MTKVSASKNVFISTSKKRSFRKYIKNVKKLIPRISKDSLRWPLQESAISCILFLLFLYVTPVSNYFREASISALVFFPITLETTSGGSLRKNFLYIASILIFSFMALGYYSLITIFGTEFIWVNLLTTVGAGLIPIPAIFMRAIYPNARLGLSSGISLGENVLLGSFVLTSFETPIMYTLKLLVAIIIACITVVFVSHFIMPHPARHIISQSASDVINILADILDPVVSSGSIMQKSSLNALFTPYSQIKHTLINCYHSMYDLQDLTHHQTTLPLAHTHVDKPRVLRSHTEKIESKFNVKNRLLSVLPHSENSDILEQTPDYHKNFDDSLDLYPYSLKIFEAHKTECARMLNNINKCNRILENQEELIAAANREFNFRSVSNCMFPRLKYVRLLEELKTLFTHVSCFVFALNLGLKTAEQTFTNDYNVFKAHFSSTSNVNNMCTFESNLGFGGDELHNVAYHIVKVLRALADTLRHKTKVSSETHHLIKMVKNSLERLSSHRTKQHDASANIIYQCFQADVTRNWSPDNKFNWEEAFMVDAKTLLKMSEAEKKKFWDIYWLGRDRVSLVEQTLYTVYGNLCNLCAYIDDYVSVERLHKQHRFCI